VAYATCHIKDLTRGKKTFLKKFKKIFKTRNSKKIQKIKKSRGWHVAR